MCCVCFKTPINKGLFNNRVVKKYNKPPIMVEILEATNTIKNAISGRKMGRKFFEFSNFPEKSRKNEYLREIGFEKIFEDWFKRNITDNNLKD